MKRRLELMPEVLPAPTKVGTSAVRARTMARLRVMAAVGASIAAACGGSTTSSGGGSSSGGGGGDGGGRDGGLPDPNKPDSDPGYGVVDPLPAPACFQYSNPPTATISPSLDDAGPGSPDSGIAGLYLLTVTWPDADVAVGDVKLQDGATFNLEETRPKAKYLELVIRQTQPTGRSGTFSIQTSCAKGPTQVTVSISEDPSSSSGLKADVSFYGQ